MSGGGNYHQHWQKVKHLGRGLRSDLKLTATLQVGFSENSSKGHRWNWIEILKFLWDKPLNFFGSGLESSQG